MQYLIDSADLAKLRAIRDRLYTERRLTGDEMRDMAQKLHGILDSACEIPEAEKTA